MILIFILWVLTAHWFADFVCQTQWQAANKSKDWVALSEHVLCYSLIMAMAMILSPLSTPMWVGFVLITMIAHFVTDAVSSRITARLYVKKDYHNFFVVIGLDQLLHYAQLFTTIWCLT
jgi:hypothetical protein